MLHPGDTVDRYTVESLLGTGGTAVVYRVRHQALGTLHALKVLSVTSDVIRERMLTEGRVQAALQHPNIVGVTDVLDVKGQPGLLMEYVEGPTLDKALSKYRISQPSAETLFLGIAAAVIKAHEQGLVHRDLKPGNVLLSRTIEGFVPKVTDFGLAKVLEEARGGEGHTRSGVALGTPAYMAPEQIRDARTVDQRADVFALGCLLYELTTRRRAFPGDDTIAIYNHILDGRFVPPRHYVEDLPDRLDNAIKGALVVDRDHRIPDVDTLVACLRGEVRWDIPDRPPVVDDDVELIPEEAPPGSQKGPDLEVAASRPGIDPPRSGDPLLRSIHDATGRGSLPMGPRPPTVAAAEEEAVVETRSPPRASSWLLFALAGLVFLVAVGIGIVGTAMAIISRFEQQADVVDGPALAGSDVLGEAPEPVVEVPAPEPEPVALPEVTVPSTVVMTAPRPIAPPVASDPTVKILTSPPTASLQVDGVDRGRTPAKLVLPPGKHTVVVTSGDAANTFEIDVRAGAENKWCFPFASGHAIEGSCP